MCLHYGQTRIKPARVGPRPPVLCRRYGGRGFPVKDAGIPKKEGPREMSKKRILSVSPRNTFDP
jgi:hypothetical protein